MFTWSCLTAGPNCVGFTRNIVLKQLTARNPVPCRESSMKLCLLLPRSLITLASSAPPYYKRKLPLHPSRKSETRLKRPAGPDHETKHYYSGLCVIASSLDIHVAVARGVGEPIYELPYREDHHPTRSPDKEPRTYLKISRAQLSRLDTPQDQARPLLRRTPTDGIKPEG